MKKLAMCSMICMFLFVFITCAVAFAEYDSCLIERICEDIPYSDTVADLIEKPRASFSQGDFSITVDEYIYDGCNLYLLYTVESRSDDPVLFASDYLHFVGGDEWVNGDYSVAAGFGSVLCLDDRYGKSRELMATMNLEPSQSDFDAELTFTGWFFEPLTEIELNEAGYSVNTYKNGDADTLPATIEASNTARQIAEVNVSLPIIAERRDIAYTSVPISTDFGSYSVTITEFFATPLSTAIEFRIDAKTEDELQAATKKRSYAVRDIDGNLVVEMNWYSEELEDDSGKLYIKYVGDSYGKTVIPDRIQIVPYSTKTLDEVFDQNPDISWDEAEKQASIWDEAIWIDIDY